MGKRLTDTDKWKKPFIKSLPVEYKLFFLYLLDDCDHAGIWHIDMEVAEIRLGVKLSLQKARGFFAERIVEFDNRTKWFIPDFISFQYGAMDEKNKMYNPIARLLNKYDLMEHLSPIYGGKVKVKEKEKEEEEVFSTNTGNTENTQSNKGNRAAKKFVKPTVEEVTDYLGQIGLDDFSAQAQANLYMDHFIGNGWLVGRAKAPMRDWKATVRTWKSNILKFDNGTHKQASTGSKGGTSTDRVEALKNW